MKRVTVVLESDEDGVYVASVPVLKGCHTQGKTVDQAMRRMREAVELWLEVHRKQADRIPSLDFVGTQQLDVPT